MDSRGLSPTKPWAASTEQRVSVLPASNSTQAPPPTEQRVSSYASPSFTRPPPYPYLGYGGGFGYGVGEPAAFLQPQLALLSNIHYTVGSIGAITELLGVNAEALQNVLKGALKLLENLGQASGELLGFLHVRLPVDAATGLPTMTRGQYAAQRRKRVVRWALGTLVFFISLALTIEWIRGGKDGSGPSSKRKIHAVVNLIAAFCGIHAGHKLSIAFCSHSR